METEPVDQHPDKGLVSGSSKDGLNHVVAMEEDGEEGRAEEGEEARTPKTLSTPVYVSKAERERETSMSSHTHHSDHGVSIV